MIAVDGWKGMTLYELVERLGGMETLDAGRGL